MIKGAEVITRQRLKMVMGGSGDDGDGGVDSPCKGIATCRDANDCEIKDPGCSTCRDGFCAP